MSDAYALHWEREAVNDFSSNIRNVSIYEAIQRLLETAMENLSCVEKDPFIIVDYGTADGANFLAILENIKGQVLLRYGEDKQMFILLNDLPSNDFKSVWININGLKEDKIVYFATVAQSFYHQCFPSQSVHLGFATTVSHYIQRLEELDVNGTISPSAVQDDDARRLIASAVEVDWQNFLLLRSEELAPGGILLCTCLGTDAEDDRTWQQTIFEPLDTAWQMLYKDGYISQNEMDAGKVPIIVRNESQHKKPFLDPTSPVSRSGLQLMQYEKLRGSWLESYKPIYDGKITEENQYDILKELGQIRTACFKALYYPHIYKCLHTDRPEAERRDIMEKYFEKMNIHLSSSKLWLDFPDDTVVHIMIIKKK